MKKQFAYMLMGPQYDPKEHQAHFETEESITHIFTVRNFDEAKEKALECLRMGVGVIECCGAFQQERAQELIELTGGKIGIGYVINEASQADIFRRFFSK